MSSTEFSPITQPGSLTEMNRFMFECYGYLLIEDVLSSSECQGLCQESGHAGQKEWQRLV